MERIIDKFLEGSLGRLFISHKKRSTDLAKLSGLHWQPHHSGDGRFVSHFLPGPEHCVSTKRGINRLTVIISLVLSLKSSNGQVAVLPDLEPEN